jgi:anti-anti-sigma regulatory factor
VVGGLETGLETELTIVTLRIDHYCSFADAGSKTVHRGAAQGNATGRVPLEIQHIPLAAILAGGVHIPRSGTADGVIYPRGGIGEGGFFMSIGCSVTLRVMIQARGDGERSELVRGLENQVLDRVKPLVRNQSVMLDMRHVERIDAAGIAALITLYCVARQANHEFTVSHTTARVEEILTLVGVKHLLAAGYEEADSDDSLSLQLMEA